MEVHDLIASRLRVARARSELSLTALAASSGVNRRTLIMLEQGQGNPSIATLGKIAGSLQIPLVELIADVPAPTADRGEARLLHDVRGAAAVELWSWRLGPLKSYEAEPDVVDWEEIVLVTEGEITIETSSSAPVTLQTGHSHRFATDQPYSYRASREGAHFIRLVIVPQ